MAGALVLQGIILLAAAVTAWIFVHRLRQRNGKDPKTWPLLGLQLETALNFHRLHDWIFSFFRDDHRTGETSNYIARDFLGDGIFNSDGDVWKRHRKVASFEFSNRKLRDFSADAFREDALRIVRILHSAARSDNPIDLQDLFMRMTLDSICQVGFGVSLGSLSPELPDIPFAKAFDTVNEIITIRFFNAFWPIERALNIGKEKILKKEVGVLNSFTANIIHQRRLELQGNNRSKVDLLSRFMSYNENDLRIRNCKMLS
ncbi:hypothetical protein KP509_24G048000 [Ceratopteris richardii]|uniref:Cytochrome P450 n=1 Tax=Ceratopteris richardii TaxID=49495 RepID=A0A8T2RUG2_CERRI|nr:hypothetical protein KP509_24G048000 [Ceratopteris richardii]